MNGHSSISLNMSCNKNFTANVESCIRERITDRGYTDADFQIESGSNTGDNYLGIINKITIRAKDAAGKTRTFNWIIKTASESETFRELVKIPVVYAREMLVYETVFPEYEKLQDSLNIAKRFASYPEYLFGSKSIPETLIMEDMKAKGFVLKNRVDSLDFHHVKLVMGEYGRLHGLSFALRELKPEVFARLSVELREVFFSQMDLDFANQANKGKTEQIEEALQNDPGVLGKFKNYTNNMMEKIIKLLNENDEYSVICHGDSWVNNMLFKYEPDSKIPTELCFLDFQLSRFGSPAFDLSYFIYTCTDQKLRDEKFEAMLEVYHASLVDFLKQFSLDGEKLLPYEVIHDQMKRYSTFGLFMSSVVLHLMLSENDEIPDLTLIKDSTDDQFNFKSKNEHVYVKRMREVVMDMAERNYI